MNKLRYFLTVIFLLTVFSSRAQTKTNYLIYVSNE
ncbi:MAG: hypothetical protein QOD03_598, partial [Verrucomicrobiota bacterium]